MKGFYMRQITIVTAAMVVLLSIGCASKPQAQKANDIFADEADGLLFVRNETGVDLVLLAGNVSRNIVLGGIRARSSRSFDISKIENIPEQGAFIVQGVSQNIYQGKNGFITSDDVLYSGLVVFNLKNTEKIQKTIPNTLDETSFCITVENDSRSVCELRLNSPDGIAITVLRPGERNRRIWIKASMDGGYAFFPNFIGYVNGEFKNVSLQSPRLGSPVSVGGMEPMMVMKFADTGESREMQMRLLFE